MGVKYVIDNTTMTDIADPLRSLSGREDELTPAEMAQAGDAAVAEVNTQEQLLAQLLLALKDKAAGGGEASSDAKDLIERTISYISNEEITTVGANAFAGCALLEGVSLPMVTSVGNKAFLDCAALQTVALPKAETIGTYAFQNCDVLESIALPAAKTVNGYAFYDCALLASAELPLAETIGSYAFGYCVALTSVSIPKATLIDQAAFQNCKALEAITAPVTETIGLYAFQDCTALKKVDLPLASEIGNYAFRRCTALEALILRSETVCELLNANALTGSAIANGTGYVYVPASLVSGYQTGYWTNYAAQIRAIEDYPGITGG